MSIGGHEIIPFARNQWEKVNAHDRCMIALAAIYVIAVSIYLFWHGDFFGVNEFFIIALVAALFLGRIKAFLWDWLPLVLLLSGYEYVRGLVPEINDHIHMAPMIDFDRFVFGNVPTLALQARLYKPGELHWFDYGSTLLYFAHFLVPLTVAFIFWLKSRPLFKQYATCMVTLSYISYLTYLIFPAAPPWMAAEVGLLPPVARILNLALSHFGQPIQVSAIYRYVGVNLVAAVPSLHAAYPLLTSLFVVRKAPKLIPLAALYTMSVWFAVVYLGEHYVFDVVLGVVYALFAYGVVVHWLQIRTGIGKLIPSRIPAGAGQGLRIAENPAWCQKSTPPALPRDKSPAA
jgi:hypothetical protein